LLYGSAIHVVLDLLILTTLVKVLDDDADEHVKHKEADEQ